MKRTLWVWMLLAAPLCGQAPATEEYVNRLISLKYVDPGSVNNLLSNFGVQIRQDGRTGMVAVSGPKNRVTTAEEAIRQIDTPKSAQKNVEMTAYFVEGTDQPAAQAAPIPAEIQSVVSTLKSNFPFKTYFLLDTLALRTRTGSRAEATGRVGSKTTAFSVQSADVDADGTRIRLDRLNASLRTVYVVNGKAESYSSGVSAEVMDIKEGQKLVVGKSSLDGPTTALFLVVIAKVVE